MKATAIVPMLAAATIGPAALAETVDQLMADHTLLNAELKCCKKLGMASVDDMQCILAARLTRLPYQ